MLEQTYEQLKGARPGVCRNAFIESFCIHARNLIEFYRGKGEVNAGHFTADGIYKPKFVAANSRALGNSLYDKLNQQVAHMTKDRTTDPKKKIGSNDRERIMEALRKETASFLVLMNPPMAGAISVGCSDSSATNAITTASVQVLGANEDAPNA
jgi:hypothetical protein